jgi:hypothetical protein
VLTVALGCLTWQVDADGAKSLLRRQLAHVGTLMGTQAAVLRVEVGDLRPFLLVTLA